MKKPYKPSNRDIRLQQERREVGRGQGYATR